MVSNSGMGGTIIGGGDILYEAEGALRVGHPHVKASLAYPVINKTMIKDIAAKIVLSLFIVPSFFYVAEVLYEFILIIEQQMCHIRGLWFTV